MRCPRCGAEFHLASQPVGGVATCPSCGSQVPTGFHIATGVPKKKSKTGLIIALVVAASVAVVFCGCGGLLFMSVQASRTAANRMACGHNLKQIVLAMHAYHDDYGVLPAQSISDANGQPMHSWRVALLPYLERQDLYERYDFDEPWNSPNNQAVGQEAVSAYRCVTAGEDSNESSYFVVYGDQMMFAPDIWTRLGGASDGLSNTILVVECTSLHVPWTEPTDIPFDRMSFRLNDPTTVSISSPHPGGTFVGMGDGTLKFLWNDEVSEETVRYLLMPNDGQVVQLP